jgi:hypothetical protein
MSRNLECGYEVSEGIPQQHRFKQKIDILHSKCKVLEAVVSALAYSNEELALGILVQLRAGESVHDIAQNVQKKSFGFVPLVIDSHDQYTLHAPTQYPAVSFTNSRTLTTCETSGSSSQSNDYNSTFLTL